MISCIYKIHTLQKIYDRDFMLSFDRVLSFCNFIYCPRFFDCFLLTCIKWNKCQKTSFCLAFELILAFSLYSCRAGFSFLSSQYTFFFMFFIFCSFSSSWKQQKEKGEILITIKYRLISCLVFFTSCKLYTTVNLCYFQEWIMIVTLRARASSIVNFLEHP